MELTENIFAVLFDIIKKFPIEAILRVIDNVHGYKVFDYLLNGILIFLCTYTYLGTFKCQNKFFTFICTSTFWGASKSLMHMRIKIRIIGIIHQIGSHENWPSITTYFAFKIFILEI